MELLKRIDAIIAEHSLLKHPFYEMWSAGELSAESLAGYSKEYFQLVKAVPQFMDTIISSAPDSTSLVAELTENRQEESDHIKPWIEFAGELGISESELVNYMGLPKTRQAVDELGYLMSAAGFDAGAVAMYAFEKEIPKVSQTKLDGLESFYGIVDNKRATRYFELHTEADIRHAALWQRIIEDSNAVANPDSADALLLIDTATKSVFAQNMLLDACYEEYCSK